MALARRLAALVVAAGLGIPALAPALAQSAAFSVSEVAVDLTADDAAAARAKAVAAGQREAVQRLFRRLVPVSDHHRLPSPADAEITELVRGFEVADERVAPNRYIASLTFHFKPNEVGRLLRVHGIPYAVTPSRNVVVLPLFGDEGDLLLWEDGNPWRAAWANLPPADGLVGMIVPIGELADLALVNARQAQEGERERLVGLAERYDAGEVVVAEAVVERDPLLNTPMVRVSLRRYQGESVRVGGGVYSGMAWDALAAVLGTAARATRTQIEEEWKEANLLRFDREDSLAVDIPLKGLAEWLDIHRRLVELALVRRVEVVALSMSFARVILHYLGDAPQLAGALANSGLELRREADLWMLRMPGRSSGAEVASEASAKTDGSAPE